MSIVTEIERIKTNIANAYTACEGKGAMLPEILNSENLARCIASLRGSEKIPYITYIGNSGGGAITALSKARRYIASARTESHLLFGGGVDGAAATNAGSTVVDTYDNDLVKGTAPSLSVGRRLLKGASNSNFALFVGGSKTGEASSIVDTVDAYDKDLVRTTATPLSIGRNFWNENVVSFNDTVVVSSGGTKSSTQCSNLDIYDKDLVLTTITSTETTKSIGCAATRGNKLLLAGGATGSTYTTNIEVYDEDFVSLTPASLSVARSSIMGVSNKRITALAGGFVQGGTTTSKVIDIFDDDLVRGTASDMYVGRTRGAIVNTEYYGILAGGATASDESKDSGAVEAIDVDGEKIMITSLSAIRRFPAGGYINGKILIAGGQSGSSSTIRNYVDLYSLV